MKLQNTALLETIFALKQDFANGLSPTRKVFPGIEVAPFKGNASAAVSISGDFEMSWAFRGRGAAAAQQKATIERQNFPFILRLLDEYSIPITWATVGHLFLERCTRSTAGLAHASMPRPVANDRWTGDWYKHDPCSDVQKDPLWYAPDLVQQILDCRTKHEIGTHSFSHINFSTLYATPELIQRELESSAEAMAAFGLRPTSLVFPHNVVEYSCLPVLERAGLVAVRHRDDKVRLSYPERTTSGIYRLYESMNLRQAKYYDYVQKAKIFLQKAMARHAAYCLWFHPSDPIEVFDTQFRGILAHIDAERRSGRLWVTTMTDLASYCEARERVELKMERGNKTLTVSISSTLDTSRYGAAEISLLITAPSNPKSCWLELTGGQQVPVDARRASGDSSQRLLVDVPTNARKVHLSF